MGKRTSEAPSKAYMQEVNLPREHTHCWSHNQDLSGAWCHLVLNGMGAPAIHAPRGLLLPPLLAGELWNWRPLSHLDMPAVSPPSKRLHWQTPEHTWRVTEIITFSKETIKMRAGRASGLWCLRKIKQPPPFFLLVNRHSQSQEPFICKWPQHLRLLGLLTCSVLALGRKKYVLQILPCQKASWHQWVRQSAAE